MAMILPEGLKRAFWEELKAYEEERQMPYVTSVEQIGYDRGLQIGEETGVEKERRSLALKMLQEGATVEFVTKVTGFSVAQIQDIQTQAG
jgi:predicted transposase YdaD